jgi:hypothetical protein
MKRMPGLRNQGGQQIVEAILIIVILMGTTMIAASYFKNQEVIKKLISGPWQNLAGMIQNGVWLPPQQSNISHPNGHGRHVVITGENAQ